MQKPPSWLRPACVAASFAVTIAVLPRQLCGHPAEPLFDGELTAQDALAREVAREVTSGRGRQFYRSGSARFDGQSAIAIYQMAILGMGQIIREHPERRDEYLPAMRAAAARLTDPRTLPTATRAWGHNGLTAMAPGEGHAYLGYINLALGMLRAVDPGTPYAGLNDRLTAALAERLDAAQTGLIETYPGETWPPDVAAVAGSIGLHAAVTGVDRSALLAGWARRFETCAIHISGYLVQRVKSGTCKAIDAPRLGHGDRVVLPRLRGRAPVAAALRRAAHAGPDLRPRILRHPRVRARLRRSRRRERRADGDGRLGGRDGVRARGGARARRPRPLPRAVSERAPGGDSGRPPRQREVRGRRRARERPPARDVDRESDRAAGPGDRRPPVTRSGWACAGSIAVAGGLHAIAAHHLAAADPVAALLGGDGDASVVAAAIAVAAARLYLFFVAPGWAVYRAGKAAAGAIYSPPK